MLSEATEVELFVPTAEPVIANKDAVVANGAARQRPAADNNDRNAFVDRAYQRGILYKSTRTCRLVTTFPFNGQHDPGLPTFYAPNEHIQDHYVRLLNNNPGLCAEKRYVFLVGYSKTERIAAFVCNNDARRDATALCTTHYFGRTKMMTLRNRIILLAAFLAAAVSSGWLAYSHLSSTPIRCTGDVEWTIGKTDLWVRFRRMQHREGLRLLTVNYLVKRLLKLIVPSIFTTVTMRTRAC